MSESSKSLEHLSKELSETVNRIDNLQRKPPLRTRIYNHFSRQGSLLIGVVLAGTLFSVALDRLAQKRNYESEREKWHSQQSTLEDAQHRLQEQLQEARKEKEALAKIVRDELNREGKWLAPLATRLRQGLENMSQYAKSEVSQSQPNIQPDIDKDADVQRPDGNGQGKPPKFMI